MPTQLFTDEERARLERFPTEVSADDLNRFFRLTPADVEFLRQRSSMSAWLVGGLQIGALRMLGFVPETLDDPGKWVAGFVADQLGVPASVFSRYTRRPETRRGHVVAVEGHLRWRRASGGDLKALGDWLVERALERWDDLLRVAGSLKHGWVPASLLVPRMQASARQNDLTRAVQEYGRIAKTLSLLRYLHDPDQRRRVNTQLNKGESLHALRRWIAHANRGELHHRRSLDQDLQAQSLNLVTNAVVTWNAVYTDAVLQQLAAEGHPISNEIVAHLSPGVYEHVNVHGHWNFSQVNPPPAGTLRPLRPTVATI